MSFILVAVTGPGWSAEEQFHVRRRRRRRVRSAAWLAALLGAGGGSWLAAGGSGPLPAAWGSGTGHAAAALWAISGVSLLLLRWRGFGGRDVERWQRGSDGEIRTAAMLERLPRRRWVVRHDLRIPGSRANIDHVVVGRTGVWVVDTKATRAPVRAGWGRVRFGSRRLDTASLRWESEVVAERLEAVLGRPVAGAVRAVVSVHGRGLRRRGGRAGGVPVVPGDRLNRRIRRGRRRLSAGDVAAVVEALDAAFPAPGPPPDGSPARGSRRGRGGSARMTAVLSDGAGRSYG